MGQPISRKRSPTRTFERSITVPVSETIGVIVGILASVTVGFLALILGLQTFRISQENRYLEMKIQEMGYVVESLVAENSEKASALNSIILDGE